MSFASRLFFIEHPFTVISGTRESRANDWINYVDTLNWTLPSLAPKHACEHLPKPENWQSKATG